MKKIKNIFLLLAAAAGLATAMTACQPEKDLEAKAVLASASALTFEGQGAEPQMITVYADNNWHVEGVPAWMTVSPEKGTGTTDVTISVQDNVRDGALDNIRKATIIFKGARLMSESPVLVKQNGDKFRDVPEYTLTQIVDLADEAVVIIPSATVVAKTADGFIASDGTTNVHVIDTNKVVAGDEIEFRGDKGSENGLVCIPVVDELAIVGNSPVTYPEAKDIAAEIDSYNATAREYVSLFGVLQGTKISLVKQNEEGEYEPDKEKKFSGNLLSSDPALKVDDLKGHLVAVTGYFAGVASPVVNIHPATVEDKGLMFKLETVLYYDDFNVQKNNTPDLKDGYTKDMQGVGIANTSYTAGALVDFRTSYKQANGGGGYKDYENELWPGHSGVQARTGAASAHIYPCVTPGEGQSAEADGWFQINDIELCGSTYIQMGMGVFNSSDGGTSKSVYHLFYKFDTDSDWVPYTDLSGSEYNWEWQSLAAVVVPAGATSVSFRGEATDKNYIRFDDITLVGNGEGEIVETPYLSLLSDALVNVPAEGGEVVVKYSTNVDCQNNLSEFPWITPTGMDAADGTVTVTLKVAANESEEDRTATIKLSNAEKALEASVTIKQKGVVKEVVGKELPFVDDFSWMMPLLSQKTAGTDYGDPVGEKNVSAPSYNVQNSYPELVAELEKQGYVDLNAAPKVLYACADATSGYWKFGKTGYHNGLQIPAIKHTGDITISFNWAAQLTTAGVLDEVDLRVSIVGGPGKVVTAAGESDASDVFTTTQKTGQPFNKVDGTHCYTDELYWQSASVTLTGITPETKIIIAPSNISTTKDGSVCKRWYLDNLKVEEAIADSPLLAKWAFSAAKMTDGEYYKTFGPTTVTFNADGTVSATAGTADKKAGNGGSYLNANDGGKGKIEYYQVDKTTIDTNDKALRCIGATGQPYIVGGWPGDYWLISATAGKEKPAGTKVQFSALSKCSGTGMRYWTLEYKDGSTWKPAMPTTTAAIETGETVTYNVKHENTAEYPIDVTVTMENAFTEVQFRLTCAANAQASGKGKLAAPNGGTHRFSGDENTAPKIMIVE